MMEGLEFRKLWGVVACETGERAELSDEIIGQLKFTRRDVFGPVQGGVYIREVFDFDNGYRLELAKSK